MRSKTSIPPSAEKKAKGEQPVIFTEHTGLLAVENQQIYQEFGAPLNCAWRGGRRGEMFRNWLNNVNLQEK